MKQRERFGTCVGSWLMNFARGMQALCSILLFSVKQAVDLTLDTIIMQFVSFFILFAFITAWSFQNLKWSSTDKLSWCGGQHSQTKMTPPQPNICLQISRSLNDLWLHRRSQPSPTQPPRLADRDFLLRWEPSRHSPAIKGLPSVTEADLQQELIHTVSHVCSLPQSPQLLNIHTKTNRCHN